MTRVSNQNNSFDATDPEQLKSGIEVYSNLTFARRVPPEVVCGMYPRGNYTDDKPVRELPKLDQVAKMSEGPQKLSPGFVFANICARLPEAEPLPALRNQFKLNSGVLADLDAGSAPAQNYELNAPKPS